MTLSTTVTTTLLQASSKALATYGPRGINVVPVSMIKIHLDSIWLFDFFMEKTVQNIATNPQVALSAWTDMTGIQIKAEARYVTTGTEFTEAVNWVRTQNPSRVVKGLLILTPTAIYDISPGKIFTPDELEL